jgi:hypothetical protein
MEKMADSRRSDEKLAKFPLRQSALLVIFAKFQQGMIYMALA